MEDNKKKLTEEERKDIISNGIAALLITLLSLAVVCLSSYIIFC